MDKMKNLRLEEALKEKPDCVCINQNSQRITDKTYIHYHKRKKQSYYSVDKYLNGELKHFGKYSTLEEAQKDRDLLVKSGWDYKSMIGGERA